MPSIAQRPYVPTTANSPFRSREDGEAFLQAYACDNPLADSILHLAVRKGDLYLTRLLLEADFPVGVKNANGQTPLLGLRQSPFSRVKISGVLYQPLDIAKKFSPLIVGPLENLVETASLLQDLCFHDQKIFPMLRSAVWCVCQADSGFKFFCIDW